MTAYILFIPLIYFSLCCLRLLHIQAIPDAFIFRKLINKFIICPVCGIVKHFLTVAIRADIRSPFNGCGWLLPKLDLTPPVLYVLASLFNVHTNTPSNGANTNVKISNKLTSDLYIRLRLYSILIILLV